MKVLLLASGRSTRMQPVKDKNFLNFCGKSLIEWQTTALKEVGLTDILIVGGKHNLDRLGEFGETIEQIDLEAGMAGAILACKEVLGNEPVLVVSSNDIVDKKAYELVLEASKEEGDVFLIGKKVDKYFPGGYLSVKNGLITDIVEKPGEGNEPSDMINLVVHLFKQPQKFIEYLEKTESGRDDRYEMALDMMIKDGVKMKAVPYLSFWQPIKYPWHVYPAACHFFGEAKKFVSDKAEISDRAVIKGEVIIEEGVKVFENAVISGPAYIGRNVIVANNALVRGSFIGDNCIVGFATEIKNSVLGHDVWTHTNYVGDSVIGNNCSFGSGAVTGNLRLDEGEIMVDIKGEKVSTGTSKFGVIMGDDIRVGVNTSLMPGVKIGSGSFVGAGIVVGQDVPEGSFVRGDFKLKVSENKAGLDEKKRVEFRGRLENPGSTKGWA